MIVELKEDREEGNKVRDKTSVRRETENGEGKRKEGTHETG